METDRMIDMTPPQRIGIMADSHGQSNAIAEALAFFKRRSCVKVYHVGDICDSFQPETAHECVTLLHQNQVQAIKGNNDHAVVVNHEGSAASIVPARTIDYLKQLPLVLRYREAVFAHGLPFEAEQGLSCMIGILGPQAIASFCNHYPQQLLFRGHQHDPEIVWQESGKLTTRKIIPNKKLLLAGRLPCIVTCGALDNGYCMIWKPDKHSIICYNV
jgi:predicted phosphodiesterase